jgi:hypothetical protein
MIRQYLKSAFSAIGQGEFGDLRVQMRLADTGSDGPADAWCGEGVFEGIGSYQNAHELIKIKELVQKRLLFPVLGIGIYVFWVRVALVFMPVGIVIVLVGIVFSRALDDFIEFSAIEPDAAAFWAIIYFHAVAVGEDEGFGTNGTLHRNILVFRVNKEAWRGCTVNGPGIDNILTDGRLSWECKISDCSRFSGFTPFFL